MYLRRLSCALMLVALIPLNLIASPAKDLEKAAQKGQIAFILVTEGTKTDVSAAKTVLKDTVKQAKRSTMVELDRSNPDNAEIVKKYKLATIPVPMILALNANGVISGAIQPNRATSETLLKMVPTPKKLEVMKALSNGNAVFIMASHKGMTSSGSVSDSCAMACQKAPSKSICVSIDMDDKEEAAFLTELKIDTTSSEPVTIVANPKGQVAAKYTGEVKVSDLVEATTKKIGGCCPPKVTGETSTCGPTKK
jgi:hypothetical protein